MRFSDTLNINDLGHLEIGGCDAVDLVTKYSTPLYVLDEQHIREVCRKFKRSVLKNYGLGNMAYASTAFSCIALYKLLQEEEVDLVVYSGGELYTAIKSGFDLKNAYLCGNNKTEAELRMAIENHIGRIIVGNVDEIKIIDALCEEYKVKQNIMISINGDVESNFGFSILKNEALEIIELIEKCANLHFYGLSSQISSPTADSTKYVILISALIEFMKKLKANGVEIEEIAFGGGFGPYYSSNTKMFNEDNYDEYGRLISKLVIDSLLENNLNKPRLVIQPGRSVISEAGVTLYKIGSIKETEYGKKFIAIDGGMFDNMTTLFLGNTYEVMLANKAEDRPANLVSIAGKSSEKENIIFDDVVLPEINRDDILALLSTGDFKYALSNNMNRNLLPTVIFVKDGKSGIVIKGQTYEDILKNDVEEVEMS